MGLWVRVFVYLGGILFVIIELLKQLKKEIIPYCESIEVKYSMFDNNQYYMNV